MNEDRSNRKLIETPNKIIILEAKNEELAKDLLYETFNKKYPGEPNSILDIIRIKEIKNFINLN